MRKHFMHMAVTLLTLARYAAGFGAQPHAGDKLDIIDTDIIGTEWTEESQVEESQVTLGTESAESPEVSPCDKDEHRGGSDFWWVSSPNREGPFWAPDATICRNSCRAIDACEYFSWFPSRGDGSPQCWLHPAAGSEKASGWDVDAGAISGPQSCILDDEASACGQDTAFDANSNACISSIVVPADSMIAPRDSVVSSYNGGSYVCNYVDSCLRRTGSACNDVDSCLENSCLDKCEVNNNYCRQANVYWPSKDVRLVFDICRTKYHNCKTDCYGGVNPYSKPSGPMDLTEEQLAYVDENPWIQPFLAW